MTKGSKVPEALQLVEAVLSMISTWINIMKRTIISRASTRSKQAQHQ